MAGTNMKALTLLAVLLCLEEAWAINCHNCMTLDGNTCQNKTNCPPTATACFSHTASDKINGKVQTIKNCTSSCDSFPTVQTRQTFQEASYYCCSTDLCNGAWAQGPRATTVGLMLVASVLTTLLGASV
ncbi:ly-6/neurotoxin-like protein 1 [Dasypus novemcinctus]|uniref:ly-6/neurotoxin-like protein 1 n=1 Tax=Dasypus novemcinctus TaxID=9361 RepID=UPI000329282C|nr:lymphocyte antigen 6B-like [Dasypus novemcinctus]XP_058132279.1 lymphocyte antigen 6B-like [Dasypus novemcinctus]